MATKSRGIYHSKHHPRPKPIGYIISQDRKRFPRYLFDKNHDPIFSAMEEYRNRNYRYPLGVTPIYKDDDKKGEKDDAEK